MVNPIWMPIAPLYMYMFSFRYRAHGAQTSGFHSSQIAPRLYRLISYLYLSIHISISGPASFRHALSYFSIPIATEVLPMAMQMRVLASTYVVLLKKQCHSYLGARKSCIFLNQTGILHQSSHFSVLISLVIEESSVHRLCRSQQILDVSCLTSGGEEQR